MSADRPGEERPAHRENPTGYGDVDDGTLEESTRDPGAEPEDAGLPGTADDLRTTQGTHGEQPRPMRRSVPTEVPVASLDYGTTELEESSGESHGARLERETPESWEQDRAPEQEGRPVGTWQAWDYRDRAAIDSGADLVGYRVLARDGEIGTVDQASTDVGASKLVVDTSGWITGKRVLLPAGVVTTIDAARESVYVDRSREEISNAPEMERDGPEYESRLSGYYAGWYGPAATTATAPTE